MATKAQIKESLHEAIASEWHKANERIQGMAEQKSNPQVALMIEKNRGYMMALDDVRELLYSRKIF